MKRNSYDSRRKDLLETLRKRVKANVDSEKDWPRITSTRTYQFFITKGRIYKLK